MPVSEMSIGDLASATGVSARAVRFYVQQGLLHAPLGRGRGSHYDPTHLARLQQILEFQQAGHSLDAIRKLLRNEAVPEPERPTRPVRRAELSAELWTRIQVIEGVELHYNATRHQPDVQQLLELRELIRKALRPDVDSGSKKKERP
jgi:DNA-binding transcriptional MerR regulator